MRTVPRTIHDRISFYETHIDVWEQHAAALGLSPQRLSELRDVIVTARTEFEAAAQAQQAAQAATLRMQEAVKTLHSAPAMGQNTIDTIKLTASTTGDIGVYALAQIDPPQSDSPLPAPNTPSRVESKLLTLGEIELSWTGKQPSGSHGTLYQIERAVDGDIDANIYEFVGISGGRRFIDATLPVGPERAVYRITAIRGQDRSLPGVHLIFFGVVREPEAIARTSNALGQRQRQAA